VWKNDLSTMFFGNCLELLLLQETQGSLPWALQQLQPYRTGQPPDSSKHTAVDDDFLGLQWPLVPGHVSSTSTSTSTSSTSTSRSTTQSGSSSFSAGTSNSRSSGEQACQCHAPTCHLCTPPPPVTLQQLRLVLEVVCLTCQETSAEAVQAPLLLALLVQRASPEVRASFLDSADGTRLLVALQQMGATEHGCPSQHAYKWCFHNRWGALTVPPVPGSWDDEPWLLQTKARAVSTLSWCFLELNPGAMAPAAPAPAPAPAAPPPPQVSLSPAGATAADFMTPAAVAQGSLFVCNGRFPSCESRRLPTRDQHKLAVCCCSA
jgi:hypothetical protein